MPKLISSVFTSLDGFAADSNGDIRWFRPSVEFLKYSSMLTQQCDTAVYGRKTFEMMQGYWPTAAAQPDADWHDIEHGTWYNQSRKIVFSKTLPKSGDEKTLILGDDSIEEFKQILAGSSKDLVIFGSPCIVSLLTEHQLIDEYYIFIVPVLLGSGRPLFHDLTGIKQLKLIESKAIEGGSALLHYQR